MPLTIIIAGLAIALFLAYFFYTHFQRSGYLLFVVFFLPLMDLGVTPAAFGGLSVFDFITFISFAVLYKDFFFISLKKQFYLYLVIILLLLLLLGSIASEFTRQSIVNIPGIITPFLFSRLLLLELNENNDFVKPFLNGLKTAGIIAVLFILLQMLLGLSFTFYPALNQNVFDSAGLRYPGYFMDSQMNGVFLGMLSYVFLLNYWEPSKPTIVNYISFSVISGAILLAGSRSGLLGFVAGFIFLILFVGGKFRFTTLAFGAIAVLLLYISSDSIVLLKRFTSISDSYTLRSSIWQGAVDIFNKHPNLGIGIGNYQEYVKLHSQDQYLLIDNDEIFFLDQPENGYLKLLTEFGLFGFVILMILILWPVLATFLNFIKGKKIVREFFFAAPVFCWLLSFNSLYTLSDSRVIIVLAVSVCFLLSLSKNLQPTHEN